MARDFLPRAHSRQLGQLDMSNWKDLRVKKNSLRIDPAIREIISILNAKGYKTFSSCSGGHKANLRRRWDRHESGYIAFSPPSRVPFSLYLDLRRRNLNFMLEAEAVVHDANGDRRETIYTQLDWQLIDQRKHRLEYYETFFEDMKRVINQLPTKSRERNEVLTGLFGNRGIPLGSRIVAGQLKRFSAR